MANKRDKITNCAWCLVLKTLAEKAGSVKKAKTTNRNLNWRSLQQAVQKDLDEIIVHYKTTKKTAPRPSTETVEKVKDFYNRDNISRQLPYKNLTRKIKDCFGKLKLYTQYFITAGDSDLRTYCYSTLLPQCK